MDGKRYCYGLGCGSGYGSIISQKTGGERKSLDDILKGENLTPFAIESITKRFQATLDEMVEKRTYILTCSGWYGWVCSQCSRE